MALERKGKAHMGENGVCSGSSSGTLNEPSALRASVSMAFCLGLVLLGYFTLACVE